MFILGLLAHRLYTDPEQYRHVAGREDKPQLRSRARPGDSDSDSGSDSDCGPDYPAVGSDHYQKMHAPASRRPRRSEEAGLNQENGD